MRMDDVREGGALRTVALETAVVGLRSFQCLEMDGHRLLNRAENAPGVPREPDLRRLLDRSPGSSPSLKQSSPGDHSGGADSRPTE